MRFSFLPFSRPAISELEIEAVAEVLRSGWITTGPRATEFEEAFQKYCNAKSAVVLCSATAGMHLLLVALGIGPGDEVITPSMTWVSTVNLIVLAGATPVFADTDRDTLMVSAETIEPLITDRTRLIVPVHFAGASVDMEPLRQLASAKDIHLVEDAAHAAGTEYHFKAVHTQKYYRETLHLPEGALSNTEWNSDRICSLPMFPDMTLEDVDEVVAAIKEVLA